MSKITVTTNAWLYEIWGPEDIKSATPKSLANMLAFGDKSSEKYSKVGTAEITIDLADENQMILNKVDSLRAEITKTRADAEMKARELEDKVQQLLAITNEVKS